MNIEQANMLIELKETQQKAENLGFAMTFFTPNELQYTDSIQFKSALEQQSRELLAISNEDSRIVRENDLGGFM
jgi:hypothetical protein